MVPCCSSPDALQRMAERGLTVAEVASLLRSGETIAEYPEDLPYSSRLVRGWVAGQCVHIVAADDSDGGRTIIVTVYRPDPQSWDRTFGRKRR